MNSETTNRYLTQISDEIVILFEKIKSNWLAGWAVAFFSLFNWQLGKSLADSTPLLKFIADTMLTTVIWSGFVLFFIPIVHSIAERSGAPPIPVGETTRNVNLASAILIPFMPLALILRAASAPPVLISLTELLFRLAFLWQITTVIKKSYGLKRITALTALVAPVWFFTLWISAATILGAIWAVVKFFL